MMKGFLNIAQVARAAEILKVEEPFDDLRTGGLTRRMELTKRQLKMLLDEGLLEVDAHYNDSPQVREFIKLIEEFPRAKVSFLGLLVIPPRPDSRVDIEGFNIADPSKKLLSYVVEHFRGADEFNYDNKQDTLRAWWD